MEIDKPRFISGNDKQMRIYVPFGIGFNPGDLVSIIPVDDNEFRIVKVKISKREVESKVVKEEPLKVNEFTPHKFKIKHKGDK